MQCTSAHTTTISETEKKNCQKLSETLVISRVICFHLLVVINNKWLPEKWGIIHAEQSTPTVPYILLVVIIVAVVLYDENENKFREFNGVEQKLILRFR